MRTVGFQRPGLRGVDIRIGVYKLHLVFTESVREKIIALVESVCCQFVGN